ncbi:MAG: L,D-transpeptidase [Actinomycetota bacterium]|nr:L,D-transpeptidase [Actinomycetota bacterium]
MGHGRFKRVVACWAAVALALVGSAGQTGFAATRNGTAALAARQAGPVAPTLSQAGAVGGGSLVADATVPRVLVFDSPGGTKVTHVLTNPTFEGVPLVMGVKAQQGDWLQVMLPERPNGTTGWVQKSQVGLRTVPNRILVELSKFKLSVFRGNQLLMETPVGIGTPGTPTPIGQFYVDVAVPYDNPRGPYGVFMLSVAGFSDVLTTFAGGRGQIAIHGTSNERSVGIQSSNGCLRVTNPVIMQLKDLAPTGTPVQIVA